MIEFAGSAFRGKGEASCPGGDGSDNTRTDWLRGKPRSSMFTPMSIRPLAPCMHIQKALVGDIKWQRVPSKRRPGLSPGFPTRVARHRT
eukprot:152747-Prorocentrum_minimum.AAC.6